MTQTTINGTVITRPMTPEEKERQAKRVAAKKIENKGKKPPRSQKWDWPGIYGGNHHGKN